MPKKQINNKKYYYFTGASFVVLVFFVFFSGPALQTIFSNQVVLSGVDEKAYAPRNFVKTNSDPLITSSGDYFWSFVRNYTPTVGENGPKVIFFGDFTDPQSREIWYKLMDLKDSGNEFVLAWKNFPVAINNSSRLAGVSALCAARQNKFLEYADLMFQNQDDLDSANLRLLAKRLGLNLDSFDSCLDEKSLLQFWGQDLEDGQNLLINSSPYLFVGNSRIENQDLENLEKFFK